MEGIGTSAVPLWCGNGCSQEEASRPERADRAGWLARQTVFGRVEVTGVLRVSPGVDLRAGYLDSDAGLELGWVGLEAPTRARRGPGYVGVRGALGGFAAHGHPDGEYTVDTGLWLGGGVVWRPG